MWYVEHRQTSGQRWYFEPQRRVALIFQMASILQDWSCCSTQDAFHWWGICLWGWWWLHLLMAQSRKWGKNTSLATITLSHLASLSPLIDVWYLITFSFPMTCNRCVTYQHICPTLSSWMMTKWPSTENLIPSWNWHLWTTSSSHLETLHEWDITTGAGVCYGPTWSRDDE